METIETKLKKVFPNTINQGDDLSIDDKFLLIPSDDNKLLWITYNTNNYNKAGCPLITKKEYNEFQKFYKTLNENNILFIIDSDLTII